MPAPRPDETVRLLMEACAVSNLRRVLALVSPDVRVRRADGGSPLLGAAAVRAFLERKAAAGARLEPEGHRFAVEGDKVHVQGRLRVFEAGMLVDSPFAWTFTVRDGRVTSVTPLGDDRSPRSADEPDLQRVP